MGNVLQDAIKTLSLLEVAEGRLAKETLLQANQDNKALQAIIRMAIGPDRYFVRPDVNVVATSALTPADSWRAFRDLAEKLKNRKLTGNEARKQVQRFLAQCRPILMKWYCRILNHDLRCGVDKSTVTAIWGPEFLLSDSAIGVKWQYSGCSLAKKYEDVYKVMKSGERKPRFPQALEPKLDGERANLICFPRDGTIFVLTRSGRRREKIEQVPEYVDQVLDFCRALNSGTNPDRPLYLDGEFLAKKWNDTSSIIRRTKNFNQDKFLREVRTMLWDWAPLDQYMTGKFDMKWIRRKFLMLHAAGATRPTIKATRCSYNVWVLGHSMVYDEEQLMEEYNRYFDAGHEGAMMKNPDAAHVFKRTADLVKMKPEDEITGRIIEVQSGQGSNAAVPKKLASTVKELLAQYGPVEHDAPYFHVAASAPKRLITEIKKLIDGDNERRTSTHREGYVSFRAGERLGQFIVELDDGRTLAVGGGFTSKAGSDQRTEFWQKRDELVGMKLDFRQQKGNTADAVSRFPRFARLREDLS